MMNNRSLILVSARTTRLILKKRPDCIANPKRNISYLKSCQLIPSEKINVCSSFPFALFSTKPNIEKTKEHEPIDGIKHTETPDYFRVLGIERTFSLNLSDLSASYKKLMSDFHPDRHVLKSAEVREKMSKVASDVTEAYTIISHPHSRAMHLLTIISGDSVNERDTGALVGNVFLMSIMEIREVIDDASSDEQLKVLRKENSARTQHTCDDLAVAYENDCLDDAKICTAQLQYWNRIEVSILEKITSTD
eukprot:CAMPEP_0194407560 /NCGR_PEP_ID=MMETSP0176-20130528/5566_1 /TAXON_ID=216777 /ORGANISM="Proboscia alata, Strain PI-D3" /LENGTH=249 /DNA_ID=CAMNT_0039207239 /DNA_START=1 /DNA_END=750 /DNA_ORIENTATION=+